MRNQHLNRIFYISGNVYGGNAIGIHSSIKGDVYGGGNGSYAYTDNIDLKESYLALS